jgi:GT2 family glycosyltransferase
VKKQNPLVSVVLVNFNGKRFLNNCLRSIFSNSYSNLEVIVVDNNSSDNSLATVDKKILQDKRLIIIKNSVNTGPAGGLNLGAKNASGKYLAVLGYDTKVDKDWLTAFVSLFEKDRSIGLAQGKIMRMDKKKTFSYAGDFLGPMGFLIERAREAEDIGQFDTVTELFSINSASMMIPLELFRKLGSFDEDYFMYLEEADLCFRVHLCGKKVVFCPDSVIYHNHSVKTKSKKDFQKDMRDYRGCRNYILTLIKNLGTKNLLKILPLHLSCWLGLTLLFCLKGDIRHAFIIQKAIFWHILNIKTVVLKRRSVQKNIRKVEDSFFKHTFSKEKTSYYIGKAFAYLGADKPTE